MAYSTGEIIAIIVPVCFSVIFLVGTVGNALVILVVLRNKTMRNTPNILILNLAITDLLFIVICVPFTAVSYMSPWWPFGDVLCKIVYYFIYVTFCGSIYTLVLMAVSRYIAIVHSMRSLVICTPRNTYIAIAIMWVVILMGNIYNLISFQYIEYIYTDNTTYSKDNYTWYTVQEYNRSTCVNMDLISYPQKNKEFFTCLFLVYAIPLILTSVLYGLVLRHLLGGEAPGEGVESGESLRIKKEVTKMVVIVVAVFAVCWLPNLVLFLVQAYGHGYIDVYTDLFWFLLIASNCLAYMNSAINPVIYAFLSENFRKEFRSFLCCCYNRRTRNAQNARHPRICNPTTAV